MRKLLDEEIKRGIDAFEKVRNPALKGNYYFIRYVETLNKQYILEEDIESFQKLVLFLLLTNIITFIYIIL